MAHPDVPRGRTTLLWVVESLSTASGLAFLASAIAHATAFQITWGLNYFAVASPTDVVMGAFNIGREGWRSAFVGVVERTPSLFSPFRLLGLSLVLLAGVMMFSDVFIPGPGRPPSWLYTGLTADGPNCGGARVHWLGSQSALIACGDDVHVERRDALKLRTARRR